MKASAGGEFVLRRLSGGRWLLERLTGAGRKAIVLGDAGVLAF